MTKRAKINTLFVTKTAEKPYPLGPYPPGLPAACDPLENLHEILKHVLPWTQGRVLLGSE